MVAIIGMALAEGYSLRFTGLLPAIARCRVYGMSMERNLGEQPIARIMERHAVSAHDLVSASSEPMTHKMVARACKGRRLTRNTQQRVLHALNAATDSAYGLSDLFNYGA